MARPIRKAPKMWRKGISMPWPRRTSCQRAIDPTIPTKRIAAPMSRNEKKVNASMFAMTSSTSCQAGATLPSSIFMGHARSSHTMRTVR